MTDQIDVIEKDSCQFSKENKKYTWIQYKLKKNISFSILDFQSSRGYEFELNQSISEKLSIEFRFRSNDEDVDWANFCLGFNCTIKLQFMNNLHEVIQNRYSYEVVAYIHGRDEHFCLFKKTFFRSSSEILFTVDDFPTVDVRYSFVKSICIGVRRYSPLMSMAVERVNLNQLVLEKMRDGFFSDVSLSCKNQIIPAHKCVLAINSKVFDAMFTHDMIEKQKNIVEIDDFEAKVLDEMLNFIYIGKVKNMDNIERDLYRAAHKYQIQPLIEYCLEYFDFNCNCDNVVDLIDLATAYNNKKLLKSANHFMNFHEEAIVTTKSYQERLCRNFSVDSLGKTLILCNKFDLESVKLEAFEFIKINKSGFSTNQEFLNLIYPHEQLMKEIVAYILK